MLLKAVKEIKDVCLPCDLDTSQMSVKLFLGSCCIGLLKAAVFDLL